MASVRASYNSLLVLLDLNTYRPVRREELLTKCGWIPLGLVGQAT